jgi:antirestriction protein ArdC
MSAQALYDSVTANIIQAIEKGDLPPWLKPWKEGRRTGIMPINAATKSRYHGLNVLMLWAERDEKAYPTAEWLTFKQALDLGGHVRKGEKSTHVIFVKRLNVKDSETEEDKQVPMMKVYSVFNISQCDGLPQNKPEPELPEHERNARAEAFFEAIGATVRWNESMAAYIPSKDVIVMPPRGAFHGPENLYATWAHEAAHWTGAKHRLDRDMTSRFKTDSYAFEELVAELSAAMTCSMLQITGELRHASYVENWLKVLKGDSRAILTAASLASKASDYLTSFSEVAEEAA